MRPIPIITLTTDFGTADAYVGAMKGVILGLVPTVVAIVLGRVTMPVVGFQLAFAAICVLVASSTDTRSFMERMADASTPPGGAR